MKFRDLLTSIGFIADDDVIFNMFSISHSKNTFMYYMLDSTRGNAKITVCFDDSENVPNSQILEICNRILQGGFLHDSEVTKLQTYMTELLEQKQAVATVNIFMNWSDEVKSKEFATIENLENLAIGLEDYIAGQPVNDWATAMSLKDEDIDAGLENTVIADIVDFS